MFCRTLSVCVVSLCVDSCLHKLRLLHPHADSYRGVAEPLELAQDSFFKTLISKLCTSYEPVMLSTVPCLH